MLSWAGIVLAGLLNGSFAVPLKTTRVWKFNHIWTLHSLLAMGIMPWIVVMAVVPRWSNLLARVPARGWMILIGWGLLVRHRLVAVRHRRGPARNRARIRYPIGALDRARGVAASVLGRGIRIEIERRLVFRSGARPDGGGSHLVRSGWREQGCGRQFRGQAVSPRTPDCDCGGCPGAHAQFRHSVRNCPSQPRRGNGHKTGIPRRNLSCLGSISLRPPWCRPDTVSGALSVNIRQQSSPRGCELGTLFRCLP